MQQGPHFTNHKPHGNLKYGNEKVKQWRVMVSAGKSYSEIARNDPMHPHPKTICKKLSEELNTAR